MPKDEEARARCRIEGAGFSAHRPLDRAERVRPETRRCARAFHADREQATRVVCLRGEGEEKLGGHWTDTTARVPQVAGRRGALGRPRRQHALQYRLLWPDGRDAGRAAYTAGIRPGDIVVDYRGQWLRVLATRSTGDEDSVYDGVLEVEPA